MSVSRGVSQENRIHATEGQGTVCVMFRNGYMTLSRGLVRKITLIFERGPKLEGVHFS